MKKDSFFLRIGVRWGVGMIMGFICLLELLTRASRPPREDSLYFWHLPNAMLNSGTVRGQVAIGGLYLLGGILCLNGARTRRGFNWIGIGCWSIATVILVGLGHRIVGWVPFTTAIVLLCWDFVVGKEGQA